VNEDDIQRNLLELAHARMPFGKYAGSYLSDLPEAYVLWFQKKGFPSGRLGELLEYLIDIKANGMEGLLREIRRRGSRLS
jgi:uncharacterized protein (DUF3820 family)